MQKRSKMGKRKSKKLFSRTARSGHMFNRGMKAGLKRGGIRL
ncbi:MAG: hypothetical protein [Arizlama microvirus]|nr:MAG: hypothetical protein [Arizlama microvirus]